MLVRTKSTVDANCIDKVCNAQGLDAVATGKTLIIVNTAAWIVGGLGLGTGAFFLLSGSKSQTTTALAPSVAGRAASHVLRRKFLTMLRGSLATLVRAATHATFALACVMTSCVVIGTYDFEGYHPGGTGGGSGTTGVGGSIGTGGGNTDGSAPDGPPICIPQTCEELHAECGKVPDGCDGALDCGGCEAGICGGGGRNKCGQDLCPPRTMLGSRGGLWRGFGRLRGHRAVQALRPAGDVRRWRHVEKMRLHAVHLP
jgi:hypothetical protein